MVMLKVMQRVADKYGVDVLFTNGYGTYVKDFMFLPPLTEEEYDWKFWIDIEK